MDQPFACPVCGMAAANLAALASHLITRAEASDGPHVMWLNRRVTKHRTTAAALEPLLAAALAGGGSSGGRINR